MRISSLSFTTKAAPQSTIHSQVTTVSSVVQPVGKLKKYRKTICTMNAKNMTPSRAGEHVLRAAPQPGAD